MGYHVPFVNLLMLLVYLYVAYIEPLILLLSISDIIHWEIVAVAPTSVTTLLH